MPTRTVLFEIAPESSIAAWSMACPECPLKPHFHALNLNPKPCAAGIQTKIQGAITLNQCEHYTHESIKSDGETLTIECRKD